jgi:glyoxylase-like metal-dependent hydrolase (beta-lactamase superfamily II)
LRGRDEAVRSAGVKPEEITDVAISHAHWITWAGSICFRRRRCGFRGRSFAITWQAGGQHGGIDPEDVKELVRLNTEGRLRLVDGDNVEIFPGIRAYTGARHTYASQYIRVEGSSTFVLASDSCYRYWNLAEHKASATFSEADQPAHVKNQARMIELAGSLDRVVPGHDALRFQRYPTQGRIAHIK